MSFLSDFRALTSGSEVHPNHAVWAGFVAMSSLVGRKVWINMGHFRIYPNLYVIFVAPPGARKSTALNFVSSLLEKLKSPVTYDAVTKESLAQSMTGSTSFFAPSNGDQPFIYSPTTVLATEMSEFIGPSREGMISFLTTLFDKADDYHSKTLKRGLECITKPYLVLLGCTTPAWITARLRDDVISGGFSRRAIFVYETDKAPRVAFPDFGSDQVDALASLVAFGRDVLQRVYGEFYFSPDAKDFFTSWYLSHVIPKDPYLAGYFETKHVQVLKLAMLASLAESSNLLITLQHIEFALAVLALVESNLSRVFEGATRSELSVSGSVLLGLVRGAGGCLGEKIVQASMMAEFGADETKEITNFLVSTGRLIRKSIVNKQSGASISTLFTLEGLVKSQRDFHHDPKQRAAIE